MKSVLIVKKKLIVNLYKIKNFKQQTKIKSYGDEATDFHDEEIPKVGSNRTCLA